jgi:hypothetical protein
MAKQVKNIAASVKAKLLNIASEAKIDFNLILRQYVQERFLYRVANSHYSNNFILKGALLFLAYDITRLRPTRDIDFKGDSVSNDIEVIKNIFAEILNVRSNDGLIFNKDNIAGEPIAEDGKDNGIRIKIEASLDTAVQVLQVDIGFGDEIYKGPIKIDYPVLLDQPAPKLLAYSIESAVAEKFEAIVSLGMLTSRMKDFYDILFFAQGAKFSSTDLLKAIDLTFKSRNTNLEERKSIYEAYFKKDKQKETQWSAFLRKNKLHSENNFGMAVDKIKSFIEPILLFTENKTWNPEMWSWK